MSQRELVTPRDQGPIPVQCQMHIPPEDTYMSWAPEATWWPVSVLEQPKPERP